MATIEYAVTGMTCGNCEKHVREEVEQISGDGSFEITGIEVSAAENRLVVTTAGAPVDDAAVIAAVDEAGYTATRE